MNEKKLIRIELSDSSRNLHAIPNHTVQGVWLTALDGQGLCTGYFRRVPFTQCPVGRTPPEFMQWAVCVAVSSGLADKA